MLYVILFVAATFYNRTDTGCELERNDPQDNRPKITIPFIHVVYNSIRDRIGFVREAFSLGFNFPSNHTLHSFDITHDLKENDCCSLMNIDFDLFKSIINMSSKHIYDYCTHPDNQTPILSIQKCAYIIQEYWSLFDKKFNEELISLRYWTRKLSILDSLDFLMSI